MVFVCLLAVFISVAVLLLYQVKSCRKLEHYGSLRMDSKRWKDGFSDGNFVHFFLQVLVSLYFLFTSTYTTSLD